MQVIAFSSNFKSRFVYIADFFRYPPNSIISYSGKKIHFKKLLIFISSHDIRCRVVMKDISFYTGTLTLLVRKVLKFTSKRLEGFCSFFYLSQKHHKSVISIKMNCER